MNNKRAASNVSHLRLVQPGTADGQDLTPADWRFNSSVWRLVLEPMPKDFFKVLEPENSRKPYLDASLFALRKLELAHVDRDPNFSSFDLYREVFLAASDPLSSDDRLKQIFAMPTDTAAARHAGALAAAQECAALAIHEAWIGDVVESIELWSFTAMFFIGFAKGKGSDDGAAQDSLKRMFDGAARGGLKGAETRRAKAKVPSPSMLREQRDRLIATGTAPREVAGKLAARHGCSPGHIRKTLEKQD